MRRADRWILLSALAALLLMALFFRLDGRWEEVVPLARIATRSDGAIEDGGYKIDINRADEETFATLPGIGPALAARIVEHREVHGAFASVDALTDVAGIGDGKLEAVRAFITASPK